LTLPDKYPTVKGQLEHGADMPKIEIRVTDAEKARLEAAAAARSLRPATWAKAVLMQASMPWGIAPPALNGKDHDPHP
jgi:hypothetical protein